MLKPLERSNAETNATASVIWLHGLGANGYDFAPVAEQLLQSQALQHLRFILPHAPEKQVTINNGYVMPAWYDLYSLSDTSREDQKGILESQYFINTLIEKEIARGISANRIAIAGFSQGGAIALQTGLRYKQSLAGILALSTYLPLSASLADEASTANKSIPILMAHGENDEVIRFGSSQQSLSKLLTLGYNVAFHSYPMAHAVCEDEIAEIEQFLKTILPT